jgi:hypothetical protein
MILKLLIYSSYCFAMICDHETAFYACPLVLWLRTCRSSQRCSYTSSPTRSSHYWPWSWPLRLVARTTTRDPLSQRNRLGLDDLFMICAMVGTATRYPHRTWAVDIHHSFWPCACILSSSLVWSSSQYSHGFIVMVCRFQIRSRL